jgi:preprotein translocase subunit SecA
MAWTIVKDMELKPWTLAARVSHTAAGQAWQRTRTRTLALSLLKKAEGLRELSDARLRERAAAIQADPAKLHKTSADDGETFPLIIEAIRRGTTYTLHPNQVMAAVAMSRGFIVEMATGEGKTFSAMLAGTCYALGRRNVHMMTANAYLAKRDAEAATSILGRIGITAASLDRSVERPDRAKAYRQPLIYSTLSEIGFDWLRDRLAMLKGEERLLPRLHVALIDEADQIMIDEARTPLVLAAAGDDNESQLYRWAEQATRTLRPDEDFIVHGRHDVEFTQPGVRRLMRGIPEAQHAPVHLALLAVLRARLFYRKNVQYVVQPSEEDKDKLEVVIVDEKTGRLMPGRRWHDGLHEAIMTLEGLPLDGRQKNIAQITVQQFLAQYDVLCGCSGTIIEAARELYCVYGRPSLKVPTHRKCRRVEHKPDVYVTRSEQFRAAAEEIRELREQGRAVLVGTTHISTSQRLSRMLKKMGIAHEVLTALDEVREAQVVAQAGKSGAVTIATNLAGRGTDIKLEDGVSAAGGLHVLSLQRHESIRVDRQLIGRCARQGDPGSCRFILCLQDPLLRAHAADDRSGFRPRDRRYGSPITTGKLRRLFNAIQRRVETQHRDARIDLISRATHLEQMFGRPDYLSNTPPTRKATSIMD